MNDDTLELKLKASLAQAVDDFNKVTNHTKIFGREIDKVITKIDNLGNKTSKIKFTSGFGKYTNEISRTVDKNEKLISETFKQTENHGKGLKNALSTVFDANKLYFYWNVTKKVRDAIKQTVTSAIDYLETQNKFNVSMGAAKPQAVRFVNQISEAVGMAKADLMDYQSTYKNILSGLGNFTDEQSERVSESLVKMALDYSSLYNVGQADAMKKFQSALTGSIRPIRNGAGYDISESSLSSKLDELGIERSVTKLSEMEKRILRIIVLMDQMRRTGAMNDLARTIEQPANQLRVLKAQIQEVGVWIGNVFMGTIGKVLPYINAFVMVIKELIKMLAIFVGFTGDDTNLSDVFEDVNTSVGGIDSGLGRASKKAKELRKTLMGFDVLNVINTPTQTNGAGGSGGGGGIDPKLLDALKDYDSMMDKVKMKATDIRDRIMEWLGFTKIINPETGEITWKLNDGYTKLELILDIIKAIGVALLTWKISSKVTTFLSQLGVLQKSKALQIALGLTLAITGITIVYGSVKSILNGDLSAGNLIKGLAGSAIAGVGAGLLFTGPVGWTVGIALAVIVTATYLFKKDQEIIHQLAEAEGIDYDGMSLSQKLQYRLDLSAQILGLKEGKNPLVIEMRKMWKETWEKTKEWLKETWTIVENWFNELPEKLGYWLGVILGRVTNFLFVELPQKYWEWRAEVEERVIEFFTKDLYNWIVNNWETIKQWAMKSPLEVGIDIIKGLWNGISSQLSTFWKNITDFIKGFIDGFKEGWGIHSPSTVFKEIGENIFKGLLNGLENIWNTIKNKVTGWVNEIKGKFDFSNVSFKTPHISWKSGGASATGTLKTVLEFLNLPTSLPKMSVSWYRGGGLPNLGELFVAREAGPELVGKIGNSNAVMNNQQIVQAVSQGVAQAVASVMGNRRNGDMRLIVDGRELAAIVEERMARNERIYGTA